MAEGFRLARVLRLRGQLRERARDDVARARAALGAVRERQAAARALEERTCAAEAAAASRGTTAAELLRFRRFTGAARAREAVLAEEAAGLAAEVARRREVLLARRREERQLEILRERARERSEAKSERAEMVLLDELMMRRR
jgi:flagellar export protein FliJ